MREYSRDDRVLVYDKGAGIKLSENFNSNEFDDDLEDETNHFTLISPFLIVAMQQIRSAIGQPVTISSGFRTEKKNTAIGGATRSYHTKGMAADWTVLDPNFSLTEFYNIIIDPEFERYKFIKGVGLYEARGFIHIDIRNTKNRVTWKGA